MGELIVVFLLFCVVIFFVYLGSEMNKRQQNVSHNQRMPQKGISQPQPKRRAKYCTVKAGYRSAFDLPSDYTVIDTETTGLDPSYDEVIEIGAIRYRNHEEVARFQTYVHPDGPLNPEAQRINGITWRDVDGAPDIDSAIKLFLEFIEHDILVGYNVRFDIKFLQTRSGIMLDNYCVDVLPMARTALSLPRYRLDDLRQYLGIGGKSHNVLDDCRATGIAYRTLSNHPTILENIAAEQRKKQAFEAEQKRIMEESQAKVDAAKAEKERLKKDCPSVSELNKISANMTGTINAYIGNAARILIDNGIDEGSFKTVGFGDDKYLAAGKREERFFSVRLTGRLRYILLPIAPDTIHCDFVVTPSSMQEGLYASRVFVSSPEDLYKLSAELIRSYAVVSSQQ